MAPVVDVRDGHVVNATRDAIRLTDAHHRDVNDFVHVAGDDLRKMTDVARSVGICEKRHLPYVADVLKSPQTSFPAKGADSIVFASYPS